MAQTFLTVQEIAKESLFRLENNLVMAQLVYKDYGGDFAEKGDTIQVRKPATFTAADFTTTISAQEVIEDKTLVTLDKIADVSVDITSKELSLNIQDFGAQVAEGAMQAIAQKIDAALLGLYKGVGYYSGGSTPANQPNALADIAGARKVLNDNKAPMRDRYAVWSPGAEANLLILDAIAGADKSGSTDALREANMGRLYGFDNYMSQNVASHTKGTLASTGTIQVDGAHAAGVSTLTLKGSNANLTGTVVEGDILVVNGYPHYVTAAGEAAANALDVSIEPLRASMAGDETVTIIASHTANIAFHKNAFALVNRPLALPMGGAAGAVENYNGLSIRVTMGYAMSSKTNTISFDILYGVKVLEPKLATRIWRI